jgi:response regulator RpfG family c-di-GMP phosphodiesterase
MAESVVSTVASKGATAYVASVSSEKALVARWRHAWVQSSRSSHQRSRNSMIRRLRVECDSWRARTHSHRTRERRSE